MRRINAITTALAIAFLLSQIAPDNWTDRLHFAGIPWGAFIIAGLCFVLLVQLLLKPGAISLGLLGGFAALIVTAIWGYLRGNIETYSLKFFAADIFCFGALLAGYC